ncbi:MAG TPA: hypothetical protein VNZ52_15215, partial [Candidatus Thermoplasmatota archaeon]|nr:hypothetical protein [Candidatus Thermoplasmatota archaeon]
MLRVAALLVAVALAALPGCLSASQLRTALDPTSYAREVLSSDPYAKLVVEIDHPPTSPPAKNALDHLERTLREVTSKENIEIRLEASLESTPEARWTVPEIHRLAEASRTHEHGSPDAVIHVLYLEGEYAEGAAGGLGVYA